MAYGKRKSKRRFAKNKKRRFAYRSRRYSRRGRTSLVNRSLNPFPAKFLVRMKYSETFQIPSGSTTLAEYRYNLNSVYDPNNSGIGHQPYGYDTYSTVYNKYRVYKVTWSITAFNAVQSAVIATEPCNNLVTTTNMSQVKERPRVQWKVAPSPGDTIRLRGRCNLPNLAGVTSVQYKTGDTFWAPVGNSPSETLILRIFAADVNETSNIGTTTFGINLTYHCEFFDQNGLAQSVL